MFVDRIYSRIDPSTVADRLAIILMWSTSERVLTVKLTTSEADGPQFCVLSVRESSQADSLLSRQNCAMCPTCQRLTRPKHALTARDLNFTDKHKQHSLITFGTTAQCIHYSWHKSEETQWI